MHKTVGQSCARLSEPAKGIYLSQHTGVVNERGVACSIFIQYAGRETVFPVEGSRKSWPGRALRYETALSLSSNATRMISVRKNFAEENCAQKNRCLLL